MKEVKQIKQTRSSSIYAAAYVSESELKMLDKNYDSSWETNCPDKFNQLLWNLGLNVYQAYQRQDVIPHRNKLNKVVVCSRWVGNERYDQEWINSGYASQEAIDRDKNNALLDSLYSAKLFTVEAQQYLESKDRSSNVEDSE